MTTATAEQITNLQAFDNHELIVTGEALDLLDAIAKGENKTREEILAEALTLKQWFINVNSEGGEVFVKRGEKLRKVTQR